MHNWVQKADLRPTSGESPNRVGLDGAVIQIDDVRFWPYAGADPATNHVLHVRLHRRRTTALMEPFVGELREKHDGEDASSSSTAHPGSKPPSAVTAPDFSTKPTEIGTPSNVFAAR